MWLGVSLGILLLGGPSEDAGCSQTTPRLFATDLFITVGITLQLELKRQCAFYEDKDVLVCWTLMREL